MKKKFILAIIATAILSPLLMLTAIFWLVGANAETAKGMVRFLGAKHFVESQYVDEVDDGKLIDGAITGMVQSLDDPHSIYLGPEMYKTLIEHTEGTFGGIGVVMGFKNHKVTIISVMDGTPGEAAGLKANDEIKAVDGTAVTEIQPEEVALHIRGEVGTDVSLTIHREGEEDRDVTITRDNIQVRTAAGRMLETDGIGYIRIASFSENTGKEFKEAYDSLVEQGMNGLVIDLRENPGGLVSTCVEIADLIVPKGPIVSVVRRDGSKEEYQSDLTESKYPIVVLIDGNSASASEILSGALQDTEAGTLVGTKSYGKGSVQVVMPMADNSGLKLTVAKYYTPSGRSIDGTGIEPDVPIELDAAGGTDNQLAKAIEVMQQKLHSADRAE